MPKQTTPYQFKKTGPRQAEWRTPEGASPVAYWYAWVNDDDPSELLAYQYDLEGAIHNVDRADVRDAFQPGDVFQYFTINSFG